MIELWNFWFNHFLLIFFSCFLYISYLSVRLLQLLVFIAVDRWFGANYTWSTACMHSVQFGFAFFSYLRIHTVLLISEQWHCKSSQYLKYNTMKMSYSKIYCKNYIKFFFYCYSFDSNLCTVINCRSALFVELRCFHNFACGYSISISIILHTSLPLNKLHDSMRPLREWKITTW